MTKRFSVIFLVLLSFLNLHVYGDSLVTMNRSGWSSSLDDYQQTMQTAGIHDYPINGILYPVIGFPSMVTEDLFSLSIIFRLEHDVHFSEYEIEYVKIFRTDENGKNEFLMLHPAYSDYNRYSYEQYVDKIGPDTWLLRIFVPYRLPEAKYDIALKIQGEDEMISRNAVFFPRYEYEDPTKFIVFSNLQTAGNDLNEDLNFNSGEYPHQNENPQKGIVDAAFSQFNAGDSHFAVMLGNAVSGIDFQNEYSDFYDLALNLEIPMFATPGERDLLTRFASNDIETTSLPEFDGLEYWSKFIGPTNNVFIFRGRMYLLLNTDDETPQGRMNQEESKGCLISEKTLEWLENYPGYDFAAVFGHSIPAGGMPSSDTSAELLDILSGKNTIYFAGQNCEDSVISFDEYEEIVPNSGITSPKKTEFVYTTAMSGEGNGYSGFRKVKTANDSNLTPSYSYTCGRYENCQPDDPEKRGMQSVPAGNMWVKYSWESESGEKESLFSGGDGSSESVTAEIVNWLPTEEEVTLRFIMPAAKYGYKLDNANFTFTDAVASSDLSTVFLTVKGKIAAGSTLNDFYDKNFTKFTDYVTISPNTSGEKAVPEAYFPEKIIFSDFSDRYYAYVQNHRKFSSLIWQVQIQYMNSDPKTFDFASGKEIDLNDIVEQTYSRNYYLRYTTPNGISGRLGFTTVIEEHYDGCCDGYEDDHGTDTTPYSDEDGTDTDSADSGLEYGDDSGPSQEKSGSGCSLQFL